MTTTAPLDFVDSDGHVLEHPDGMLEYAPRDLADRIWHIETDADGTEWCIYDRQRLPANGLALAGTAPVVCTAWRSPPSRTSSALRPRSAASGPSRASSA